MKRFFKILLPGIALIFGCIPVGPSSLPQVTPAIPRSTHPSSARAPTPQTPLDSEIQTAVFQSVDFYSRGNELLAIRNLKNEDTSTTFADSIWSAILTHEAPQIQSLGGNEELFALVPENEQVPVSLTSHPFCELTAESVRTTISHEVSADTLKLAQELAKKLERSRTQRRESRVLYARLMSCLSYTESLSTADTKRSDAIASAVAPADYERPSGVLFYVDSLQKNPESSLNIGLYQFAPAASGNIQACMRSWNGRHRNSPHDLIALRASNAENIRLLGNASQDFNAFCGVDKITQIFYVQVNSLNPKRTHPANQIVQADGTIKLKPPAERCVTLHFNGKAYNHFGPFQDSTRKNLDELLRCTLAP